MATYKIKTKRFLRKYSAAEKLPVSAALIDAQRVVDELCNVPWQEVAPTESVVTSHDESKLDENVANRDLFDAALFCAEHAHGEHRAFANAACYKIQFPTGTSANLTGLKVRVTSDAYNAHGARIALVTNSTGVIPTDCATCRGEGGIHAAGVAPQTIQTVDGRRYGYPTIADCVFSDDPGDGEYALPSGGLALGGFLYVFVLLENYNSVRGNWLEGSSVIRNLIELTTDAAVPGWTDGDTIDLTVQETTHTFKVVSGGVYPDNLSGLSGVVTIQLQRTGDELFSKLTPSSVVGEDGLKRLSDGTFARLLDVPAERITYIGTVMMVRNDDGAEHEYIVIAGDFDGGTIAEIPGIYFYDPSNQSFLPQSTASSGGVNVDSSLATFASIHGGFGCVSIASEAYDYLREGSARSGFVRSNALAFIGKDGAYNSRFEGQGTYPVLIFEITTSGSITAKAQPTIVMSNFGTRFGFSEVEVTGYQMYNCIETGTHVGTTWPFGYYNCVCVRDLSTNALKTFHDTMWLHNSGTTWIFSSEIKNVADISVVGTVSAVKAFPCKVSGSATTYNFCICGSLTSVGGRSCSTAAFIAVYRSGSTGVVDVPAFSSSITPDSFEKFMISGGYSSFRVGLTFFERQPVTTAIVTGSFSSLGGSSAYGKIASLNLSDGSLTSISHPSESTLGASAAFDMRSVDNSIWFAATPSASPSVVYYDHLHPSVTDAQSAIGLRTLFAKLYSGSLGAVSIPTVSPDGSRLGAQFVVRSDTVSVPVLVDGELDTEEVPTWQLTTAKLIVPFSLPTSFVPTKLKLDWSLLSAATVNSKLLVWMRNAYVSTYPDIRNPAIYDGSQDEVDGWKLIGVVDPSLTTVTLPISPTGRFASLLFAAGLNMDDVIPASGMASPVGVGTADLNGVAGTVSGLNTGWKPDITLLG